jgi:hypothetical protein
MLFPKMTRLTVQLPDSVSRKAERMAANDGITLEQLVAAAVAEKVSAVESAGEVLRRVARADEKAVRRVLDKVPAGNPTELWDRMPQAVARGARQGRG